MRGRPRPRLFPYTTLFRSPGVPVEHRPRGGYPAPILVHGVVSAGAPTPDEDSGQVSATGRPEEHTTELQSHVKLVCRHLLAKKTHTHQPAPSELTVKFRQH